MKTMAKWTKAHLHCSNCNKEVIISVPEEGWRRFKAGEKVQNCFPYMSEEDREFLITSICAECQYELEK